MPRIADSDFGDGYHGRVRAGWVLLARSGQVYGLNGSVTLATPAHEQRIISDHIIRIAPRPESRIRSGYVCVALSHPVLGRPLVKSLAYGSSIPEIDPMDVEEFEVVRLNASDENQIADWSEEASRRG